MSTMTKQEIFDKVWRHFIIEGNPRSIYIESCGSKSCVYRGQNGSKCAFGLFIPDDKYDPGMEGKTVMAEQFDHLFEADGLPVNLRPFFDTMQIAHDLRMYSPGVIDHQNSPETLLRSKMEDQFRKIAAQYNLSIPKESNGEET